MAVFYAIEIAGRMAARQEHGKVIEDLIKGSGKFPGACDAERSSTAEFDIEAEFDNDGNLPTSVKASCSNMIYGADVCRFYTSLASDVSRLLFAPLIKDDKLGEWRVERVHEYLLGPHMLELFFGDVRFEEILAASHAIKSVPFGKNPPGKDEAKAMAYALQPRLGLITLNPKIDSRKQRRLQCSFNFAELEKVVRENNLPAEIHDEYFGRVALPFRILQSKYLPKTKSLLSRDSLAVLPRAPKQLGAAHIRTTGFSGGHLDHIREKQIAAAA